MKIKCTKCAAKCKIEADVNIKDTYIDMIPCIADKKIIANWQLNQCPECGSDIDNKGRCKVNCTKVGV